MEKSGENETFFFFFEGENERISALVDAQ